MLLAYLSYDFSETLIRNLKRLMIAMGGKLEQPSLVWGLKRRRWTHSKLEAGSASAMASVAAWPWLAMSER